MVAGEFINVDVPKKALVSQEVIYQASTAMSVVNQAGVPNVMTNDTEVQIDITARNPGIMDVQFDADTEPQKLAYTQVRTRLKWAHRPYLISDGSKLYSRVPGQMAADSLRAVSEYFAAVRDYNAITDMLAASITSTSSTAAWDTGAADPEEDVINAIKRIDQNSNVSDGSKVSVILPAGMKYEIKKLTLVENIQTTLMDHLSKSFEVGFYSYRGYKYKKTATAASVTTALDALSTSALVFIPGRETAMTLQFNPAAASALGAPLTERTRIAGRGEHYTQKMGYGCLPMWDGLATYTNSTSYKTYKIQTITGVSS